MVTKSLEKLLQSFKHDKYAFVSLPKPMEAKYEQEFRDCLMRECSRIPGLLSLHLDDSTFCNGAGNLRVVAVLDPKLVNATRGSLTEALVKADEKDQLGIDTLCLTPDLFRSLRRIDCLVEPELLWGEPITIDPLSKDQERYQYVIRLMDLFVSGYLDVFVQAEAKREVDTRAFLALAQHLSVVLRHAREVLRQDAIPKWSDFQKSVEQVTRDWHKRSLKRYMDLMPVVHNGLIVLFEAIGSLDEYFVKSNIVNLKAGADPETPQAAFITQNQAVAFIHPWSPSRGLEIMLRLQNEHKQFVDVLPTSFALQLYEYSRGNGTFHKYIRSCFKMETMSGHMERPNISMERGELLNEYANFVMSNKLNSSRNLVFGCNLKAGFAVAKAMSLLRTRKNVSRRNKFVRNLLQSEEHAFAHGT